jgi:hypothetical protein
MAQRVDASIGHEMASFDGEIEFKATVIPGAINILELTDAGPGDDSMDWDRRKTLLNYATRWNVDGSAINQEWADYVYPYGPSQDNTVITPTHLEGIPVGLGYSFEQEVETDEDHTKVTRTYTYPSVAHANAFMDEAFGSDHLRFRAVPHPQRTSIEFFKSLENGFVPISAAYPRNIKDLGASVVGWMGMSPEFIEEFSARVSVFVQRLEGERSVMPVPDLGEFGVGQREINDYLTPSLAVIRAAERSFRAAAGSIAVTALLGEGVRDNFPLAEALEYKHEGFFKVTSADSGHERSSVPTSILGSPSRAELAKYGKATAERLQAAHELVQSI